jgi:hypothetical protein
MREAATLIIAGWSIRSVVRLFNERCVAAPAGSHWKVSSLAGMLRNPALGGYASRGGKILDEKGDVHAPGAGSLPLRIYEPVIAAEVWAQLEPAMRARAARPRAANESMLRGIVKCGRCGGGMSWSKAGRNASYRCTAAQRSSGADCVGNTMVAMRMEAIVREAALCVLEDPDLLAAARSENAPAVASQFAELEATIAGLDVALGDLELTWAKAGLRDARATARFDRNRAILETELKTATEQLNELSDRRYRPNLALLGEGPRVREAFAKLAKVERTSILAELIDSVVIGPAGAPGERFNPARIDIRWAEDF